MRPLEERRAANAAVVDVPRAPLDAVAAWQSAGRPQQGATVVTIGGAIREQAARRAWSSGPTPSACGAVRLSPGTADGPQAVPGVRSERSGAPRDLLWASVQTASLSSTTLGASRPVESRRAGFWSRKSGFGHLLRSLDPDPAGAGIKRGSEDLLNPGGSEYARPSIS
jgi:hypothetical protein